MYELLSAKEACAPASPAGADPPVLDAVSAGRQADYNPVVTEPSPGPKSVEHCWMQSLCSGMLPPLIMVEPEPEPQEDCVYVRYDNDGYGRYVHLQPTPRHGYAPVNQAAAAAAGYYNPVPVPYYPFTAQQVYTHNSEAGGCDYQRRPGRATTTATAAPAVTRLMAMLALIPLPRGRPACLPAPMHQQPRAGPERRQCQLR